MKWHLIISFSLSLNIKIYVFIRNDYEFSIILSNCNIPIVLHNIAALNSRVMLNVIERIFPRICRLQSVAYAIRIVLLAHFYNTVRNMMSMVEVLSLRWRRIQRVVEIGCLRRRCLPAVHALLELIDTQIIVVGLMLMMIIMVMAVRSIVGLCSPAFWYSWSFCVRSVRRIVIGKMWQADWLIVMSHITRRRGRSWWTWK